MEHKNLPEHLYKLFIHKDLNSSLKQKWKKGCFFYCHYSRSNAAY